MECVYSAVRTECLYIVQVMCFVWLSEQTAIISLYNINWLVFITEDGMCLQRGTDCIFIYSSGYVFCMDLRTNSDYFPIQHWLVFITETKLIFIITPTYAHTINTKLYCNCSNMFRCPRTIFRELIRCVS